MTDSRNRPSSDVDIFAKEFMDDPWPQLKQMRDQSPVVWLPKYNTWAVTRHHEVTVAMRDHETFCSSAGVGLSDFRKEPPWRPPSIILEADPPEHTRARKVLADVLSPVNVKKMADTFVLEAERMVASLIDVGPIDAMASLANAYPLKVFPDAVGVTSENRHHLLAYGNMVFNSFGPRNEFFEQGLQNIGREAGGNEMDETRAWIMHQCDRAQLSADGLGASIYEAADRGEITVDEAGLLLRSFLSAGVDTTINAFGAALWALATHPSQWALLRADPSLARGAFEEAIRLEGSTETFFRTTTRATELGGVSLGEGEKVVMLLAGANRDERKFENPDEYDITRRTVGHVGYGFGIHVCVGQTVARLEGEAVLSALARRASRIELVGEPTRRYNNTLRGFATLPMQFIS